MENLDLLAKYGLFDARVPRYTSYPPANHFAQGTGAQHQKTWLETVPDGSDVSVYIHIPFCKRLCWFCACRTQGTQTLGPVDAYIDTLLQEIVTVRQALPESVRMARLHLGGGTPTILPGTTMKRLLDAVFDAFARSDTFEFSVEIDPTDAEPDVLQTLVDFGLNRASIGVQDFDPKVQDAIGRIQTFDQTFDVVSWLRRAGVPSLNVDLLYGLPFQTSETFAATIQQVRALYPDRLAIFGYAHVPWVSKRQVMINDDDLPDPHARLALANQARAIFEAKGLDPIGIDHFARSTDSLSIAAKNGDLRRNFQGYTDDTTPTLIGLGASAISQLAQGFVQNAVATAAYHERVAESGFAGHKGFALSPKDVLVADMIESLMCHYTLDQTALVQAHPAQELTIRKSIDDLLAQFPDLFLQDGARIALRPLAHPLVRIVAHRIDQYHVEQTAYSVAV